VSGSAAAGPYIWRPVHPREREIRDRARFERATAAYRSSMDLASTAGKMREGADPVDFGAHRGGYPTPKSPAATVYLSPAGVSPTDGTNTRSPGAILHVSPAGVSPTDGTNTRSPGAILHVSPAGVSPTDGTNTRSPGAILHVSPAGVSPTDGTNNPQGYWSSCSPGTGRSRALRKVVNGAGSAGQRGLRDCHRIPDRWCLSPAPSRTRPWPCRLRRCASVSRHPSAADYV